MARSQSPGTEENRVTWSAENDPTHSSERGSVANDVLETIERHNRRIQRRDQVMKWTASEG